MWTVFARESMKMANAKPSVSRRWADDRITMQKKVAGSHVSLIPIVIMVASFSFDRKITGGGPAKPTQPSSLPSCTSCLVCH